MRKASFLLPVIICSVFFISSCGKYSKTEAVLNEIEESIESESTLVPIFHVVNTPNHNIEILTENKIFESNNSYSISVKYPSTPFAELDKITESLIYPYIDKYKQNIANKSKDTAKYNLTIDYEVIKYSDSMMSFKYNIYNYLGDGNETSTVETLTFNLEEGKYISLKDIFKPDTNYLQLISQKTPISILTHHAILTENDFARFAIDNKNLTIYLKSNQIDQNSESFKVPLKNIHSELVAPFDKNPENKNQGKLIALTFDDGPNPITTPILLDGLAERDVKATFFMLGMCAENNPNIVKRMYEDGHDIGNHSYGHKDMIRIGNENAKVQYSKPNEILNSIIGTSSTLFRPPYGKYNESTQAFLDTPVILWNIDPLDWKYKNADKIANHIIDRAKDGDIILLHDIYSTSVEAAFKVIDELQNKGFTFVTVDELIRRNGDEPEAGEVFMFQNKNQDD